MCGLTREASEPSFKFEVWFIHEDDHPEGGMVLALAGEKPVSQVLRILLLDLVVAIPGGVHAIARHLHVGIVAEAGDDLQAVVLRLVQEGPVVQRRVVPVEPHGVGAERLDDRQVPAAAPGAAAPAPEGRGVAGHEVVVGQHAARVPQGHRRIADALDHALPVRAAHGRGPGPEGVRRGGRGAGGGGAGGGGACRHGGGGRARHRGGGGG
mmetsp:Transcript_125506/g.349334  ORF Transcript_125506/g.349334 Transcript_125506/m.349334 type:complete len:210 (+) Transcript_125506:1574-2203(+)